MPETDALLRSSQQTTEANRSVSPMSTRDGVRRAHLPPSERNQSTELYGVWNSLLAEVQPHLQLSMKLWMPRLDELLMERIEISLVVGQLDNARTQWFGGDPVDHGIRHEGTKDLEIQ